MENSNQINNKVIKKCIKCCYKGYEKLCPDCNKYGQYGIILDRETYIKQAKNDTISPKRAEKERKRRDELLR